MMNLLPKTREEFSQLEYWDSFFKKRGGKAFEWYGEYPELSEHIHKYIRPQDDVLIPGCGNSNLGRDLYDIGYKNITNIDISPVVVRQMLSQSQKDRPDLKYLQMNALETNFENESFSVVLDKGTLDALMPDDDSETISKILKYFKEIERILRNAGRFVCISLLQEHILRILLEYFPANNWMFRVVRCIDAEKKAQDNGENSLPVFMVVCTKFKNLPRQVLEVNLSASIQMQKCGSTGEVIQQIMDLQRAAFICSGIKRTCLSEDSEVSLDLFKPNDEKIRYTVHVVDGSPKRKNLRYAAFIVPQGRESEWLFSTPAGRRHLITFTKSNRLAVVTMYRGQVYGDFDQVQSELTDVICQLSPSELQDQKIPFLSLGSDVGERKIRLEGKSSHSGDFIVEDVKVDNAKYRRLYYLTSQFVIQSEVKLKEIKSRNGGIRKEIVDLTYLTCKHHIYMSLGTHLACGNIREANVAVIGLGGGGLCSFLHRFLPQLSIVGVDIDGEMLKVAGDWFGLNQGPKLKAKIIDGLQFLSENVEKFSAILFDVDSKDPSIGMSCPPKNFLEDRALNDVARSLKKDSGLFILNLVLRDDTLRSGILQKLKVKFQTVFTYKLEEDLNDIVVCSNQKLSEDDLKLNLTKACREINSFSKKNGHEELVDVEGYLKDLKID